MITKLAQPIWTQKVDEMPDLNWIIEVSDDGIAYEFYAEVTTMDEAVELLQKLSKRYYVAMYCIEETKSD